jgi:hypothetical protein
MTIREQVADFLKQRPNVAFCNTCLQVKSELARPEQVHQATRALGIAAGFTMEIGACSVCQKERIVIFAE